jgi:chorismate mutase
MDDLRRHEYLRQPTAEHAHIHIEPPLERRRLRARIDDVDSRLAALLEERAELSVAVQQTRATGDHGHDVGRERELIERAAHGGEGVLTPEEREMVFGAILRASRSAQRRNAATDAAVAGGANPESAVGATNGGGR